MKHIFQQSNVVKALLPTSIPPTTLLLLFADGVFKFLLLAILNNNDLNFRRRIAKSMPVFVLC